jgi:hypothetical protein
MDSTPGARLAVARGVKPNPFRIRLVPRQSSQFSALSFGRDQLGLPGCLLRAQNLTMRTIACHLGSREHNLEPELGTNLGAQVLQLFPEKLFHAAAAQTDDMCVLLLHPRLVVVLVASEVSQVELIHQAALLQQLKRAIYRHAVKLRIALLRHPEEALGVQMEAGLINEIEQKPPLARQAHSSLA